MSAFELSFNREFKSILMGSKDVTAAITDNNFKLALIIQLCN